MQNKFQFLSEGDLRDVLESRSEASPLVLSFPHSGDAYPDDFKYNPSLNFEQIDFPADKYVDELFSEARALEVSTIKANFPRTYVDVNRHQHDIDVNMIEGGDDWYGRLLPGSVDVGATLFWSKSGELPIYNRKLSAHEAKNRLAHFFIPFHQTMTGLVEAVRKTHGSVYIVDCHSMTRFDSRLRGGKQRPEIDIGTRRGESCSPDLAEKMAELFAVRGYDVGINRRYVGGEITLRYGWPEIQQHILQIELRRDLYMEETSRVRSERFPKMKEDCSAVLRDFKAYVEDRNLITKLQKQVNRNFNYNKT